MVASTTGSRVTATATLTSGISMPAMPMLRRKGTGRTTSASSEMPTVVPLKTTARPACCIALTTASSLVVRLAGAPRASARRRAARSRWRWPGRSSATRNLTMTETSVTVASGQMSRKVVGMATIAMSSGTIAMNDAKTKPRTSRAPTPATRRLDGQARAAALVAVGSGGAQRVEAGDLDGRSADRDAGERRLGRAGLGLAGVDPALRRDGDQRERGAAVAWRRRRGRAWTRRRPFARRGSAAWTLARAAPSSRRRRGSRPSCPSAASRRARAVRRRRRCRRAAATRLLAMSGLAARDVELTSDSASPAGFIAANPPSARTTQRPRTSSCGAGPIE